MVHVRKVAAALGALACGAACSLGYPKLTVLRCNSEESGQCPAGNHCAVPFGRCCPDDAKCCGQADCAAPGFCPPGGGQCAACTYEACTLPCSVPEECPADHGCDVHGVCRKVCGMGCYAEATQCQQGLCSGCSDISCPPGLVCVLSAQACLIGCNEDSDCPSPRGCYLLESGSRVCASAGALPDGAECAGFNACLRGYDCVDGRCKAR